MAHFHPNATTETTEATGPQPRGPARLVSSLRHRDWRYLWSGLMAIQLGEWMDHTAINWLVLVETNSPLTLGLVNFTRGFPNIVLSAVGGVVADRVDRRTLMVWTQIGGLLCTAVLAALASLNALEIWQIYVLLIARGALVALNHPGRSSIIGDLVPRQDITNAMALHSATFNSTRMVGPAIAGLMIGGLESGTAWVLWVHTATYVINIWTMLAMDPTAGATARPHGSALNTLSEGFAYIWREPVVLLLMILGTLPFILGQPYQSMLPVFARDELRIGPEGLGFLMTASAVGSLVGAFGIATFSNLRRKGMVMTGALIAFGLLLWAFALSPNAWLAAGLLLLAGTAFQVYGTLNSSLVTMVVPTEYRGRVMGVYQMDRGLIPVGSFIAGAIAESAGAPFAVSVMAALLAAISLALLVFSPRIRRLE